jgi:DNA-binding response OmpR family regulator
MISRLLVVEDEEHLAAGLKLNLELEGYAVDVATSARAASERLVGAAQGEGYDAIVLDVMLPDLDGFELCRRLREAGNFVPVIMLTARSSAEDRVRGLEAGADDYMVKPFSLEELLARVRSMLRRRDWEGGRRSTTSSPSLSVLAFGRVHVDFDTHDVLVDGASLKLTQLELDLLKYFSENPLRVLSREELMEKVWKLRNYAYTRTVDNFIARLRKHFEEDAADPKHFLSVRGAGYKFVPDP